MRTAEDPDGFLYKKDRCRDHLISVNPMKGPRADSTTISPCSAFQLELNSPNPLRGGGQQSCKRSADSAEDLQRRLRNLQLQRVEERHGTQHQYASDGVGAQQHQMPLCNKFGQFESNCADFKVSRQRKQRDEQRWHQRKPRGHSRKGKNANVDARILQGHHPRRSRPPHQAWQQTQRQRLLRPNSSSEHFWDLQLVRPSFMKRLGHELLHSFLATEVQNATKSPDAQDEEE